MGEQIIVTEHTVEQIAKLAKLSLTEEERRLMQNDLQAILSYAQQLVELDARNIEPTAHGLPVFNVFRSDCCTQSTDREQLLANAPAQKDGYYTVPRVVE